MRISDRIEAAVGRAVQSGLGGMAPSRLSATLDLFYSLLPNAALSHVSRVCPSLWSNPMMSNRQCQWQYSEC